MKRNKHKRPELVVELPEDFKKPCSFTMITN